MRNSGEIVNVIGGGLAGAEAAWQIAGYGFEVNLWEMRPVKTTLAHMTDKLAELVCSNSLGSNLPDRASGLLKEELRRLNSLIMACADQCRVPAGGALAVSREDFSSMVTSYIERNPRISLRREEVVDVPNGPTVIATGPLTSEALADRIADLIGAEYLYFYDALAPVVVRDSINMDIAFSASRYGRGEEEAGDYINCPLNEEQYEAFVAALRSAESITLRDFESEDPRFFEGCLPVEILASRGSEALAYGPMRPIGLIHPVTGQRPHAVVQLRQDDAAGTLFNMVGFQTNLLWPDQRRVFHMIPGLENAEFARLGQMHRNTFLCSPKVLESTLQSKLRSDLCFAGQIVGVEGYVGNAGTGLIAGVNLSRYLLGHTTLSFPHETMLGALCNYVVAANPSHFQPMKANFGLLPPLPDRVRGKRDRYRGYSERALNRLDEFIRENSIALKTQYSDQATA